MAQSSSIVATVDNDRRVRESVRNVLESAGYEAVTFESAEAFLQALPTLPPEVRRPTPA